MFCLKNRLDSAASDEMKTVLAALREHGGRHTEAAIREITGLNGAQVDTALHRLLLRNLIRCDSFDPSKRGGQAGVRRWGVSHFTPLWEAVTDDIEDSDEEA